jgi:hypothetical protein
LGKKINIIFLQTSAEAGVYVRETLGMQTVLNISNDSMQQNLINSVKIKSL